MDGLRTSLNIPGGEGLSYSPYGQRFSPGQYLQGILELVEMERQRRRTKSLIESILGGTKTDTEGIASVIGTPGQTVALPPAYAEIAPKVPEVTPSAGVPEAPKRGLLSKIGTAIGGLFDVNRPPREMVPLQQTIAEAMLKAKLEPKEWKARTWEEKKREIETEAKAKAEGEAGKYELLKLRIEIQDKLNENRLELQRLEYERKLAKSVADIRLLEEKTNTLEWQNKILNGAGEQIKKQGFVSKVWQWALQNIGVGKPTPTQEALPGLEETPSPTGGIPPEIQAQVDYIRAQGGTEQDVRELLDYYGY